MYNIPNGSDPMTIATAPIARPLISGDEAVVAIVVCIVVNPGLSQSRKQKCRKGQDVGRGQAEQQRPPLPVSMNLLCKSVPCISWSPGPR